MSPERTKSELIDALKEHSADGQLLDVIEAQLDKRWPHWKEKQKIDIRRRTLTEAEVMAQIDSALERAAGISKAKYESSNVVVNLLSTFGDASGSASITFMKNLNLTFPARETVIAGLVEMNGSDAELLHNQANGIGTFLRGAGQEARDSLVNAWIQTSVTDSKLAGELVNWIGWQHLTVTTEQLNQLIQSAQNALIQNAELRNEFNKCFVDKHESYGSSNIYKYGNIQIPTEVAEIIKSDELETLRMQAALLHQAQIEKENLTKHLSSLSFLDRVKYFQQIKSSKLEKAADDCWNRDWGTCSETELAQYSADEIQKLIEWCESQSRMQFARPQLHERRHQLRLDAMDQVRENLKLFPVESWLNELLQIDGIPIEHYPVELAAQATTEWFASLEPEIKKKFLNLSKSTHLRIWTKVVDRLSPPMS